MSDREGGDLPVLARRHCTAGRVHSSFLCPPAASDAPDGHVLITMLACPPDSPHHLAAVVLVSPPGDLCGLTRRELEILGLIVEGWPNSRIADGLFVTKRTVNAHVEHILTKLHAATRTLAAARAIRFGLYIPRPRCGSDS